MEWLRAVRRRQPTLSRGSGGSTSRRLGQVDRAGCSRLQRCAADLRAGLTISNPIWNSMDKIAPISMNTITRKGETLAHMALDELGWTWMLTWLAAAAAAGGGRLDLALPSLADTCAVIGNFLQPELIIIYSRGNLAAFIRRLDFVAAFVCEKKTRFQSDTYIHQLHKSEISVIHTQAI